jgi:hypothetical protein
MAVAALFALRFENLWPDLPVRKIPATDYREEKFLIFIPDVLDTRSEFADEEREMYLWLGRKIPGFLEGHNE